MTLKEKNARQYFTAYLQIYSFNLKLRAIGRIRTFEAILDVYQKMPAVFNINPDHLIVGSNKE